MVLCGILLVLAGVPAYADEVHLKNGDRISGEIIRVEKDVLTLETGFTEGVKIRIDWKEVACIRTDRPLPVMLDDEEVVIGTITCPSEGRMQITSEKFGKLKDLGLEEVRAVNPAMFRGYFTVGGILNEGNSDDIAVNVSTRFAVRTPRHRFTAEAKHNYGESGGQVTTRNSLASLKYDVFKTEKLYTYAQTLLQEDEIANINLRNTDGLGLGYQFRDTKLLELFVEAGLSFYHESVVEGNDTSAASGRWAVGLNWQAIPKRMMVFHRQEGYYTPSQDLWHIRAEQGVRVPLIRHFSTNVQLDYEYTNKPQAGAVKSDATLIFGVTYDYAYW
jgi:putative salt-induced outer membrane protein YdiY